MTEKKSNTVYLELPATFEWTRVFPENMDKVGANNAYVGTNGAYTMDVILTKDVFQQLKDAGSQKGPMVCYNGSWWSEKKVKLFNTNKKKEDRMPHFEELLDDSDEVKVKLDRKHDAPFTYGGPPQVAHVDGTPWDINTDGLIGNGSKGIVYVSVYEAGGLKGTRLDGVQVIDHVVFESNYEPSEEPRGGFRIPNRTKDVPAVKPEVKAKAKAAAKAPMVDDVAWEDEIPF